jgi:CheY-like chemotaxis protein
MRRLVGTYVVDGDYLEISVIDTGSGIPPDVMEHIFEPFFTTKAVGKGSGMGLAVVHGIIEAHHGHIHVESEENKGTVVRVYLPLIDQAAVVAEPTGDKLTREIRALRPEIPIILSTGFGLSLTDEVTEELGLSAVLLKPVGRNELLTTVRRVLNS